MLLFVGVNVAETRGDGRVPAEITSRDGAAMVLVPAGEFVMGDSNGNPDELPLTAVEIDRPYWIGKVEVTNEQYAQFDRAHESRFEHKGSWWFNKWDRGWPLNSPTSWG